MNYNDNSTVNSPTQEQFHEKQYQQQPATSTRNNGKFGGILDRIGSNPILRYGLRALQFIFAIITLALASRSLNKFWSGERRMRYTVFCGTLTLLYLIIVFVLGFLLPTFLIAGPLLVLEGLLCIFWLCSFIAVAARYSGYSCKRSSYSSSGYGSSGYGGYISPYASSSRITGCRSGKAAAAFAAFSFLLFLLSTLLLFFNVVRRLRAKHTEPAYLFQPGNQSGVKMSREGLAFQQGYNPDEETRVGGNYGDTSYDGRTNDATHGGYGDNATYVDTSANNTHNSNTGTYTGTGNTNSNNAYYDPSSNTNTGNAITQDVNLQRPGETYRR